MIIVSPETTFAAMNWYLFFKALHVIGFVSWFAGIFYLVRLFVYHREAWEEKEPKASILRQQYMVMERRLYHIIQSPAMLITLSGGVGMLILRPTWLSDPWMQLKLGLVLVLIIYHFSCVRHMRKLERADQGLSSFGYRLYNELPTLLLIAIVLLAVWKSLAGLWFALGILVILGFLFFLAARLYRRQRQRQ